MFDDKVLIGMSEADAIALIQANGLKARVMKIDGKPQIGIMNFAPSRVNLDIENGIVVGSHRG